MPLDFTPDKRSVYFASLKDEKYSAYSKILTQGESYLSNNPFDVTKDFNAQQKIDTALNILKSGINTEKNTEQQYVNNLLRNIKDKQLRDIFSTQLKTIFSNKDEFNYPAFINLINTILLGADNYESVLKLEKKRLQQLDQVYKKLIDTTNKNDTEIEAEKEKIRSIYLDRHSMSNSPYSSFFSDVTSTIDYLMAQYITNISDKILKSEALREIIKSQIINQENNNQEIGTYILNNVIAQVKDKIPVIVQAALNDSAASVEQLLSQIEIEQFSHIKINGQKVDFGVHAKSSKNIQINKKEKQLDKIIDTKGDKLAKLLLEVVPNLNTNDKDNPIVSILNKKIVFSGDNIKEERSIFNLIETLQGQIESLEKDQQELKKLKRHGDPNGQKDNVIQRIQDNKSLIAKLKQRISGFVHREIRGTLYKEVDKQARILAAEKIQEILTPAIVSITGPEYSELIDNFIQQVGENFFSGPKNAKADAITIQLSIKKSNKKLSDKPIIAAIQNNLKGTENEFNKVFQENLPKSGESTSYSQGRAAWKTAVATQRNKVLKAIQFNEKTSEEQVKILKELASQMKNSIVITETMKTFNQYNNEIGFLSGSLGSNIATQVGNFAELFEQAGVPISTEDQEWLITALVNCSPDTIGTDNKAPLEKYLSLMAGFAVFDEGSAEIEVLSNQAREAYITNFSPQIMHLYKLNGMYFPGSYILQRIYDNLQKTAAEAESEITNNDGAVISASASEALIGSHKQDDGVARWARVFSAAQGVTSVSVAFVSGLLNIVDQLIEAFNV